MVTIEDLSPLMDIDYSQYQRKRFKLIPLDAKQGRTNTIDVLGHKVKLPSTGHWHSYLLPAQELCSILLNTDEREDVKKGWIEFTPRGKLLRRIVSDGEIYAGHNTLIQLINDTVLVLVIKADGNYGGDLSNYSNIINLDGTDTIESTSLDINDITEVSVISSNYPIGDTVYFIVNGLYRRTLTDIAKGDVVTAIKDPSIVRKENVSLEGVSTYVSKKTGSTRYAIPLNSAVMNHFTDLDVWVCLNIEGKTYGLSATDIGDNYSMLTPYHIGVDTTLIDSLTVLLRNTFPNNLGSIIFMTVVYKQGKRRLPLTSLRRYDVGNRTGLLTKSLGNSEYTPWDGSNAESDEYVAQLHERTSGALALSAKITSVGYLGYVELLSPIELAGTRADVLGLEMRDIVQLGLSIYHYSAGAVFVPLIYNKKHVAMKFDGTGTIVGYALGSDLVIDDNNPSDISSVEYIQGHFEDDVLLPVVNNTILGDTKELSFYELIDGEYIDITNDTDKISVTGGIVIYGSITSAFYVRGGSVNKKEFVLDTADIVNDAMVFELNNFDILSTVDVYVESKPLIEGIDFIIQGRLLCIYRTEYMLDTQTSIFIMSHGNKLYEPNYRVGWVTSDGLSHLRANIDIYANSDIVIHNGRKSNHIDFVKDVRVVNRPYGLKTIDVALKEKSGVDANVLQRNMLNEHKRISDYIISKTDDYNIITDRSYTVVHPFVARIIHVILAAADSTVLAVNSPTRLHNYLRPYEYLLDLSPDVTMANDVIDNVLVIPHSRTDKITDHSWEKQDLIFRALSFYEITIPLEGY